MKEYRSKLTFVWQYLSKTLGEFKAAVLGYRSYVAFIDQSGTDNPVATVLENNTGITINWERNDVGLYYGITSVDSLDSEKTYFTTMISFYSQPFITCSSVFIDQEVANIILTTYDITGSQTDIDGRLYFEMRIYNK